MFVNPLLDLADDVEPSKKWSNRLIFPFFPFSQSFNLSIFPFLLSFFLCLLSSRGRIEGWWMGTPGILASDLGPGQRFERPGLAHSRKPRAPRLNCIAFILLLSSSFNLPPLPLLILSFPFSFFHFSLNRSKMQFKKQTNKRANKQKKKPSAHSIPFLLLFSPRAKRVAGFLHSHGQPQMISGKTLWT